MRTPILFALSALLVAAAFVGDTADGVAATPAAARTVVEATPAPAEQELTLDVLELI